MANPASTISPIPLIINNVDTSTASTFSVHDPNTNEFLWSAFAGTTDDANTAVDAAEAAFPAWSRTTWAERRELLLKAGDILEARIPELKAIVIQETGSLDGWEDFDTYGSLHMLREVAGRISTIFGYIPATEERSALVYRVPYGVILSIAPWNAPVLLGLRSIVYAIATGNTVVFKGSEFSPRSHYLLVDVFRQAGFPPGVVSLIEHAPDVGAPIIGALIAHPAVRKINFTGSSAVGKKIAELAGKYLKPVLLELGGKASAIVLEDADLEAAAQGVASGANAHAGQVCVGTERVVVLSSVAEKFTAILKATYEKLYADPSVQQVVTQASAAERIDALLKNTVEQGGKIIYGGQRDASNPRRFHPTIVTHVEGTQLYNTESFGPILSLIVADTVDDAIRIANDTEFGLSSAVWSRDLRAALKVAEGIEAGLVHINASTIQDQPTLPYGGVKSSGIGRFNGTWGFDEFLTVKTVTYTL